MFGLVSEERLLHVERKLEEEKGWRKIDRDRLTSYNTEQEATIDKLTKKLQQLKLDNALSICPIGTRIDYLSLAMKVRSIELDEDLNVDVFCDYLLKGEIQTESFTLDLVKTLID